MRILKSHPLLKLVNSYLIDASQPSNIIIQIITGVTLAMHYSPTSAFFFLVYLHMGRVIFLVMIITGFLGYVLPYGGFSVNNATLNRFFALHYLMPFILVALVLMHLIVLHDTAGSSNPLGVSGNYDRITFAPYFLFKDLITIFIFIFVLSLFVFFMPNYLGDSENYIMANPMQTPPAIVPEWYLLPFYAILRSIPNKLLGVIAMLMAILIILILPITDLGRSKVFVVNFLILMKLGACHVESPFIEFGQISTALYFSYFIFMVPMSSLIENTLIELNFLEPTQKR
ncbi:transmembrane di-heme cytochrome [Coniochaeta ligniaria NRRL 30616]|uniref:Cytochrome b n=1 Tax=Coniochaeta ligniaria NRRL 30616 TaxID=1408157 RepID=A0A1J7I3I0_9PEZI|nr:transmembrane di-heme cytochrome [Coniochaeta ligniaria NRRL 30616]